MRHLLTFAISLLFFVAAVHVEGALFVTCAESGPDVTCSGSGSANLAALTMITGFAGGGLAPNSPSVLVGPPGAFTEVDAYYSIVSAPTFGSGALTSATTGTGAIFGVSSTVLVVPVGYVSGTPLSTSTSTFAGATLSSLGMTPGTYVWTWGEGGTADSATLTVVPEPAAWCLLLIGIGGGNFLRRRRKSLIGNPTSAIDIKPTRSMVERTC